MAEVMEEGKLCRLESLSLSPEWDMEVNEEEHYYRYWLGVNDITRVLQGLQSGCRHLRHLDLSGSCLQTHQSSIIHQALREKAWPFLRSLHLECKGDKEVRELADVLSVSGVAQGVELTIMGFKKGGPAVQRLAMACSNHGACPSFKTLYCRGETHVELMNALEGRARVALADDND